MSSQHNLHIAILVPAVAKSKANARIKRIENQIKISSPLAREKENKKENK
jgi:hypothetical protein